MKILLAEDDASIAAVLQLALETIGQHQVDIAADGEVALQLALSTPYDLILMDGMMPKKTGLQVATLYRQQCASAAPIIFLSAKSQRAEIKEFLAVGTGFIQKPFIPTQICQLIDAILKGDLKVAASS